jgi:hypothetical protein
MKGRAVDRTVLDMTNLMNTSSCSRASAGPIASMCRQSTSVADVGRPAGVA